MDRPANATIEAFFAACRSGDVTAVGELLAREPGLARERHSGTTGLHAAVSHPEAVRLLLERGADPNVRDDGDNALPLHFAAGSGPLESVRALLDAGSDAQGVGDLHRLEVIGWATVFADARRDVVDLLVERGAQHHVFSAIALGDLNLLRHVIASDPNAIQRRLSQFEQEQSVLHYVIAPPDGLVGGPFRTGDDYRTLELLIELGADVEARDAKGRTPLALAMLRGDWEAMRRLRAAGAIVPEQPVGQSEAPPAPAFAALGASISKQTPMLSVPDVAATVVWYRAVGFDLVGSHGDEGKLDWACVQLGSAEVMFVPSTDPWRSRASGVSLWFRTDRIDDLYAHLKGRQLARARAMLAGEPSDAPDVRFTLDLYTAFYGQREFGIRDPNGVELMFAQSLDEEGSS